MIDLEFWSRLFGAIVFYGLVFFLIVRLSERILNYNFLIDVKELISRLWKGIWK